MSEIVINDLSPADRLALISELWDSLEPGEVPMSPAQRNELDRRLTTAHADARSGKPWQALESELRRRLR